MRADLLFEFYLNSSEICYHLTESICLKFFHNATFCITCKLGFVKCFFLCFEPVVSKEAVNIARTSVLHKFQATLLIFKVPWKH